MSIESVRPAAPPVVMAPESKPQASPSAKNESKFSDLVRALGNETTKGERTLAHVVSASRSGADLSSADLLALQVGIYRYSEAVDLSAKLVDRATSGVKTVLQGQ